MKQPAAPLPWYHLSLTPEICVQGNLKVCTVTPRGILKWHHNGIDYEEWGRDDENFTKQNAEYIVEACNNYPKAIELLKESLGLQQYYDTGLSKKIVEFLKSIE